MWGESYQYGLAMNEANPSDAADGLALSCFHYEDRITAADQMDSMQLDDELGSAASVEDGCNTDQGLFSDAEKEAYLRLHRQKQVFKINGCTAQDEVQKTPVRRTGDFSEKEEAAFIRGIKEVGLKWTEIAAKYVKTRNNMQLSNRYRYNKARYAPYVDEFKKKPKKPVQPVVTHTGDFSQEEEAAFIRGIKELGTKWTQIADKYVKTRNYTQLSNRYRYNKARYAPYFDEFKKKSVRRTGEFSEEEEAAFIRGIKEVGLKWTQIADKYVKTRDNIQLRDRYRHNKARYAPYVDEFKKKPVQPVQPVVKHTGNFSEEEEAAFIRGIKELGTMWKEIADKYVKTRNNLQLRDRYRYNKARYAPYLDEFKSRDPGFFEEAAAETVRIQESTATLRNVTDWQDQHTEDLLNELEKDLGCGGRSATSGAASECDFPTLEGGSSAPDVSARKMSFQVNEDEAEGHPEEEDQPAESVLQQDESTDNKGVSPVKKERHSLAFPSHLTRPRSKHPTPDCPAYQINHKLKQKSQALERKVEELEGYMSKMKPLIKGLHDQMKSEKDAGPIHLGKKRATRSVQRERSTLVTKLLDILQSSISYESLTTEDEEDLDSESKLKAFEEIMLLLPSVWSDLSLTKLSFVRLDALALEITNILFHENIELTYADPKTARIMSLVSHLTEMVCSEDAFPNGKPNLQQMDLLRESSMSILAIMGRHPAINLQIVQSCVERLFAAATSPRNKNSLDYTLLEELYWVLEILAVNLVKENASLAYPLTISRWPVVRDVTDKIIQIQRALQSPQNRLNSFHHFMEKWRGVIKQFNIYFTCSV